MSEYIPEDVRSNLEGISPIFEKTRYMSISVKIAENEGMHPLLALEALMGMASDLSKLVTPFSGCKEGCNHCCKQAVAITLPEATIIAKYIGRSVTIPPGAMKVHETMDSPELEEYRNEMLGKECPFTASDGSCSVYEVRPFACRTLFNISNDTSLCDTSRGRMEVPSLDCTPMWASHAFIMRDQLLGDIREFFPTKD